MNKEEGVSIAGTPSSFSLKNIGLSTFDLDIAMAWLEANKSIKYSEIFD